MRVAGVGFVCMDVYEKLNKYYPTGNGVDFAINLSKFGIQTSIVSAVGDDEYGKYMAGTLEKYGVDISHLRMEKGSTAIIKMDLNGNDRVHGERIRGVMDNFALTDDDIEFIKKHDIIHTDLTGKITGLLPLFKENGLSIFFDFSIKLNNPDNINLLPHIDYALFSYKQHDSYIEEFMKWAKSLGPRVVVATFGEEGSLAYDGKTFYKEGIIPAEVVNTVGAGDAFAAGFMYGIINNKNIQECLKSGAKLAASIVNTFEPY